MLTQKEKQNYLDRMSESINDLEQLCFKNKIDFTLSFNSQKHEWTIKVLSTEFHGLYPTEAILPAVIFISIHVIQSKLN